MGKSKKLAEVPAQETPAAADTPTEATPAAAAAEPKSRGPRGVAETAVIDLKATANPKREGSKAHARFALYVGGMTVGAFLDAGGTTPDLVYDAKHGFISIEGYDPGEVIVPKPKAEPKPKKEKVAKQRDEASAERASEVEQTAQEEAMS